MHLYFIRKYNPYIASTIEKAGRKKEVLEKYGALLKLMEQEQFETSFLQKLQEPVTISGGVSLQLHKLKRLVNNLEVRFNIFGFFLLSLPFFWDFHIVVQLEKWKRRNRSNFRKAFHAVAETDSLCSLATLAFNHPEWCFPEIKEKDEKTIEANDLGHFLIPADKRVVNNFQIQRGEIMLITGSNMAGKSTVLRQVALITLMAQIGSYVPATAAARPAAADRGVDLADPVRLGPVSRLGLRRVQLRARSRA